MKFEIIFQKHKILDKLRLLAFFAHRELGDATFHFSFFNFQF